MRYLIFFDDCDATVEMDNREEAIHYARLNAGAVTDTETWEVIADYREVQA